MNVVLLKRNRKNEDAGGKAGSDLALFRRLLLQARPFWPQIIGILLLTLASAPLALLTPVPLKIAVDSVIGSHPLPTALRPLAPGPADTVGILVLAAVLAVLVAMLGQVVSLACAFLQTYTGQRMVLEFRAGLFRHTQRLSLAFHDARGTSDSAYRILWDAPSIKHVAVEGLIPLLGAFLTLAMMAYVTARIDLQLALVALAVAPVLLLLSRWYRRPLRRRYRNVKELETSAHSVVQEVLTTLRVVKAFGSEEHEHARFVRRFGESMKAQVRLTLFQGGFDFLVGLTVALGTAAVLYLGVSHVQQGKLTLGELLIVMTYLTQLYAPLRTLSNKAADIQGSLASAERAFSLLDEDPDVTEKPNALPLTRAKGAVEFRDVSFAYDPKRPVLAEVSFTVPPGARVGISGRTGAGKTTLVSLLNRFYDPAEGQILLDGVDLRKYKLADLRSQFAIVLQEPVLFSTTVAENIAYARPEATEEEIVRAAKAANIHDFIISLPQGYDTQVGERGMLFSGGERQRISLARAFLKDAPILILDEPTSSVDTKTEEAIIDAMERLMQGRTTFMIAHRLTTLAGCDIRLEVKGGRVLEVTQAVVQAGPQTVKA
jgi:ATP-binding cassette, subfamily B, bacterial